MNHAEKAELEQGLAALGLAFEPGQIEALLAYVELLRKWNSSFNLISDSDNDALLSRHILDSMAVAPFIDGEVVLDVGSGGGLPGIPLAILNPQKHFILLDSNGKKTRFLFQAKVALGLDNVSVENCRIEHYQSPRQIDIVTCRAFSSLQDVVSKSQHLMANSCKIVAMKGRFPAEEIDSLPAGYKVTRTEQLSVPGNESQRHVIEVMRSEE